MWFRSMLRSLTPRDAQGPVRESPASPQLESLEQRRLLSVAPAIWLSDLVLTEGNAGAQNAQLTVSLSRRPRKTVTVNFATEDGGAAAEADYQATSGTLKFAPGETHKTITVPVYGDRVFEASEAFSVRLSGASRATIADGVGFVTILDDEPRISIGGAWAAEGNSGTTAFNFTVSLSAAYDQPVTVNYDSGDGTATAGDNDYLATSGTLTFAPGETTKTVVVEVVGDAAAEETETFYVSLGGASANALVVGDPGSGSIEDDDGYYDSYDWGYYSDPWSYWPGYYWY